MLDFLDIKVRSTKRGNFEVTPEFKAIKSKDLMTRGSDFYAIWDEEKGFWSTDEMDVVRLVDNAVFRFGEQMKGNDVKSYVLMRDFSTGKFSEWQRYCKALPDNFVELDSKILFKNSEVKKEDYATRTLKYSLSDSDCPAYEELVSTLYAPEERLKLEWAVGSVISGDSKRIQKFLVLFGGPGTGKSTYLNIISDLFEGYSTSFESQALGSRNSAFAMEMFRSNPILAIDHDGDLYRIEDNTKINSIVSHETMNINEKYKTSYSMALKTFMIIGTNKPVKITDAKSGILRRLIDVNPTGNKIPFNRYNTLMEQIKFELGGIASHCLSVYKDLGPAYYNGYIPKKMLGSTNDMYNFIMENYDFFAGSEQITLKSAYMRFKEYAEDANISYTMPKRVFKEEMKEYFSEFEDRRDQVWNVYSGFRKDKIDDIESLREEENSESWLIFEDQSSLFDQLARDWPAQYSNNEDKPVRSWDKVTSTLKDLDTSKSHYVRGPVEHIIVDFDKKVDGKKNLEANIDAASKWPKTYAELSKSGCGIHLHYIYDGDSSLLSSQVEKDIEIKKFVGKSSLRRKLTKCNNLPIAHISSGLPIKAKGGDMLIEYTYSSEKNLRSMIRKNLDMEFHDHHAPSISFMHKILEDAYNSGLKYDVRDMRNEIQSFAMASTNQASECLRLVSDMKFCSEDMSENSEDYGDAPIVFFDCEVFPNLFVLVAKKRGKDQKKMVFINPKPEEMENLVKNRLIGFNNRKYDNHIVYACMMGYTNEKLYRLSKQIVAKDRDAFFREAYNLSYTDIYDFSSPTNKMSLKKWEIKLGIHHQELGFDWDEPVPEDKWMQVAEYCCNDVDATEAVFDSKEGQADWTARKILAKMSGLTRNDPTNSHTKRIILGRDRNPQSKFVYTDLSTIFPGYRFDQYGIPKEEYKEGAKIVQGKSIYMGEDPSEGGYVYAEPGVYYWTGVLDIESMHPISTIELNMFGDEYTSRFKDIVDARLAIKHDNYESVRHMLNGELAEFLTDEKSAEELALGLKGAINPVYGLTSASFPNELKDPRNVDNIVAKRGALFMITLKNKVQEMGYKVVHIKTDSIKIANINPSIIEFVKAFGKEYGYTFEHESTYEKMALINDSTYIAKYAEEQDCMDMYGYVPKNNKKHPGEWTPTGDRYAVPYIFKTLFSKEEVVLSDLQEVKSVSTAIYLDVNEGLPDVSDLEKELKKLEKRLKDGVPLEDEIESIKEEISKGHDYRFVGRIGSFIPVLPGNGGGYLVRKGQNGKFGSVQDTKKKGKKGELYRWMEFETVRKLGLEGQVDYEYYRDLADEAIEKIEEFDDFEVFLNEKPAKLPDVFVMIPDKIDKNEVDFDEYTNEPLPFN